MPGRSIRIARIAGIPVGVSPLWLVIVALITWSLGAGYYPDQVHGITRLASYGLGLASALLLFASILAHELGHALVARRHGLQIEEIDLWLLGGVARMRGRPRSAGDELRFALAGPAVTAVIAALFGACALALPGATPAGLRALVDYQAEINLLILGFNLVPAFPLDGGRVARAMLWRHGRDLAAATATAARVGRAFGYALIALGVLLAAGGAPSGLWLAVVGMFLVIAAGAEQRQEQVVAMFTGVAAGELMSQPPITLAADLSLRQAEPYFARHRLTAFPVTDGAGRAIGILRIDQLQQVAPWRRAETAVSAVMNRDPALAIRQGEDVGRLLDQPAFAEFGRAVVVDDGGRPLGVLSVTDIQRAIRASRLSGEGSGPTRAAGF